MSERTQMSKTIIAVEHFALDGRESPKSAVKQYHISSIISGSDENQGIYLMCC